MRWPAIPVLAFAFAANPAMAQVDEEDLLNLDQAYEELAPYGQWVDSPTYGEVWQPIALGGEWRPYTRGRWEALSPGGWLWRSDFAWGRIPFHHGRWALDGPFGWVWIPGREWAPHWVVWGETNGQMAWAPQPPGPCWSGSNFIGILPVSAWVFAPRGVFNGRVARFVPGHRRSWVYNVRPRRSFSTRARHLARGRSIDRYATGRSVGWGDTRRVGRRGGASGYGNAVDQRRHRAARRDRRLDNRQDRRRDRVARQQNRTGQRWDRRTDRSDRRQDRVDRRQNRRPSRDGVRRGSRGRTVNRAASIDRSRRTRVKASPPRRAQPAKVRRAAAPRRPAKMRSQHRRSTRSARERLR